jgi:hypothetical protein
MSATVNGYQLGYIYIIVHYGSILAGWHNMGLSPKGFFNYSRLLGKKTEKFEDFETPFRIK